jgi:hypothetical protein
MGLNPAPPHQQIHQNESSGSLVGSSGSGGGYAATDALGREADVGKLVGDSMAILSGAAAGGGGSSPYKPKSPSRSPGPGARSGFGSSASSSSVSLVSGGVAGWILGWGGAGWWLVLERKRSADRMGKESRGMGIVLEDMGYLVEVGV